MVAHFYYICALNNYYEVFFEPPICIINTIFFL
jgi:hypothetical protein